MARAKRVHPGHVSRGPVEPFASLLANRTWRGLATVVLSAAVLFAGASSAQAQQGAGVLTGQVTDNATKTPLSDVYVTVTSPALQEPQIVTTDKSGFYRIPALPPGVYYIQFDKE